MNQNHKEDCVWMADSGKKNAVITPPPHIDAEKSLLKVKIQEFVHMISLIISTQNLVLSNILVHIIQSKCLWNCIAAAEKPSYLGFPRAGHLSVSIVLKLQIPVFATRHHICLAIDSSFFAPECNISLPASLFPKCREAIRSL